MPGSQPAGDLEQGPGVGPALHPGEPVPYPWPPHNYLELGALPTAVACARLHARNLLWEWGLDWLAPDAELLVAELVTSAVKATAARDEEAVRLRLSSDGTRVLIEVWDADPRPPAAEGSRPGRPTRPWRGERARAIPGGGVERSLGLVPHARACGQGGVVRDAGITAPQGTA